LKGVTAKLYDLAGRAFRLGVVICTVTYGDLILANQLESSPDFYRMRASHMFKQAETAESDALRKAYQAIAEDWARLAEQTEKAAKNPH
jgi:hypothetical protein